jgi:hypothetical protein
MYLAAVTITDDRAPNLDLCLAHTGFSREGPLSTPTATRDLGLYGLIEKTDTHVPLWDLNPRRKDQQIFTPPL